MDTRKVARKRKPRAVAGAPAQATVRFYCQGIGDCHLLRFDKADGSPFWMLIDCGIHSSIAGGRQTIDAIVEDIRQVSGGQLDVIVGTHEHWDHLSGFHTAKQAFTEGFEVGEVWLGWTEDPDDPQARALDTFKGHALAALQGAQDRMKKDEAFGMASIRNGVDSLMGFQFGLEGEKVRAARDALQGLARKRVRYLDPSKPPITLPDLPNLRIYVLGPPRDEDLIRVRERKSEMYGLGAATARADALLGALQANEYADPASPFEPNMGTDMASVLGGTMPTDDGARLAHRLVRDHYLDAWERRIDADWLGASAADLAIQLDDRTNNSSVVLAFEFVDTGRVLLFTADAQVGNWLGWQDVAWGRGEGRVTGPDLMARTVLLKVGHHGSSNATLEEKGLALMTDPDLMAFIPTNEADAKKVKWHAMPFGPILDALHVHAGKRVIRADDAWAQRTAGARAPFKAPSGSVRALSRSVRKGLWVEIDVA